MVSKTVIALLAAAESVSAFPWVATQDGVDTSLFRRQQPGEGAQDPSTCPVNPNHVAAAPVTAQYPYNNAINGKQGNGKGGYLVPANGDTAHYFVAPDYTKDIRGPCPGLNAAANHNFLAHDGVTTFNELVDAQQNVYNVGYDLAVTLAVLGLTTGDGDPVTNKLSIGCDATSRTSVNPALTGNEPGLSGHNKFEADTSLTRNDFFTHNGDNYRFNGTLFGMMQNVCQGNFDRNNLALYRYQRYIQSRAENPNFYFGPFSLLLYGASSFLYELMPSQNNNLNPDLPTITSFFGAVQNTTTGSWSFNGQEKIPANWTTRNVPYDLSLVGQEIFAQYGLYPVEFGGNTGNGQFNLISGPGGISNGKFNATSASSASCFLYQLATERIPSSLNGVVTPTVTGLSFALSKLNPMFKNLGCPIRLT